MMYLVGLLIGMALCDAAFFDWLYGPEDDGMPIHTDPEDWDGPYTDPEGDE